MLSSIDCLFRGGRPRQFQFLKKSHQRWNVRNVLIPEHGVLNKKRRTRHGSPLDSHPADADDEEWTVWDSCTGWRENRTLIDLLLHMYRRDIAGEQGEDPSTAEWSFFICHHNNNHWFIGTYGRRTSAFNYTLEGIYGHSSVLLHLMPVGSSSCALPPRGLRRNIIVLVCNNNVVAQNSNKDQNRVRERGNRRRRDIGECPACTSNSLSTFRAEPYLFLDGHGQVNNKQLPAHRMAIYHKRIKRSLIQPEVVIAELAQSPEEGIEN